MSEPQILLIEELKKEEIKILKHNNKNEKEIIIIYMLTGYEIKLKATINIISNTLIDLYNIIIK